MSSSQLRTGKARQGLKPKTGREILSPTPGHSLMPNGSLSDSFPAHKSQVTAPSPPAKGTAQGSPLETCWNFPVQRPRSHTDGTRVSGHGHAWFCLPCSLLQPSCDTLATEGPSAQNQCGCAPMGQRITPRAWAGPSLPGWAARSPSPLHLFQSLLSGRGNKSRRPLRETLGRLCGVLSSGNAAGVCLSSCVLPPFPGRSSPGSHGQDVQPELPSNSLVSGQA